MFTKKYVFEYYIKGMDLDEQRIIMDQLKNAFTNLDLEIMGDAQNKYKTVKQKTLYQTYPEKLEKRINEYVEYYEKLNRLMEAADRNDLFKNPKDIAESFSKYNELNLFLDEAECNKIVGCESFDSYVPEKRREKEREQEPNKN